MKPNPYLGTFSSPLISWKGQTLKQITSTIIPNGKINKNLVLNSRSLMMSRPLKLYRREIAVNVSNTKCNDRISSSIDIFDQPGGSIINSVAGKQNGLVNTIDDTFPNNTCQRPGSCLPFMSNSENALKRVRSSGMIKRQFDISKNRTRYFTNTNQYLINRNIAFEKNQYNYIRQGNSNANPGDSLSSANVYSSNNLNYKVYTTETEVNFQYQWMNDTNTNTPNIPTVTIPPGSYHVEDINDILQKTMITNKHYIVDKNTDIKILLLNLSYNYIKNEIELQVYPLDNTVYPPSNYTKPFGVVWDIPGSDNTFITRIYVDDNDFKNMIGFKPNLYYPSETSTVKTYQTIYSTTPPLLTPKYQQLFYKPSNPQFASQGGVSSSDVVLRNKFNTIQTSAAMMRPAFGNGVADALSYGVSENIYTNAYTLKDKKGYSAQTYPKFTTTGEMRTCSEKSIRG
jgi:hypothetical protein